MSMMCDRELSDTVSNITPCNVFAAVPEDENSEQIQELKSRIAHLEQEIQVTKSVGKTIHNSYRF